jgi:hypothetical protein
MTNRADVRLCRFALALDYRFPKSRISILNESPSTGGGLSFDLARVGDKADVTIVTKMIRRTLPVRVENAKPLMRCPLADEITFRLYVSGSRKPDAICNSPFELDLV